MAMDYVTLFLLEEQIIIIAVAGWQALETHTSRATAEGEYYYLFHMCCSINESLSTHRIPSPSTTHMHRAAQCQILKA